MLRRIVLLILVSLCSASFAKDMTSSFGFSATIDDSWTYKSPEEVKNAICSTPSNPSVPQVTVPESVRKSLENGDLETISCGMKTSYLYAPSASINIIRTRLEVPSDAKSLEHCKEDLVACHRMMAGNENFKFEGFCFVQVAGKRALRSEYDGLLKDVRTISYLVEWGDGRSLEISLASPPDNLKEARDKFESFIKSISLKTQARR